MSLETLSDRLGTKTKRPNHRLSIRALLPEIEQAVDDGFTITAAWRELKEQGRITCCLVTFKNLYHSEQQRAERIRSGQNTNS